MAILWTMRKGFIVNRDYLAPPDNDVLNAGMSSGLPGYTLSDDVNNQTPMLDDVPPAGLAFNSDSLALSAPRNEKLLRLRTMNPFLVLEQLPNAVRCLVLVANVAQDLPIPPGAKIMTLRGNADYYVSPTGSASVPTASNTEGGAPIYRPDGVHWFVEEMQGVSIVAPDNAVVTAEFYFEQ